MKLTNFPKTIKHGAIALAITAIFAGGYICRGSPYVRDAGAATNAPATTHEPIRKSSDVLSDFSEIAARQGPAVVNISVTGTVNVDSFGFHGFPQTDPNDPFNEFFHRFQMPAPQGNMPTHGLGSGFIVSPDGVILTNAHVVANADEVTVKLTDKREFTAKVIGSDKQTDVAVLKINAEGLPVVRIGNAQNARVGEWVVAIGSPFGFENSVTAGIISAKSRSLPNEGYVPFLQTDVAVNPGNSGGPLFNMNGGSNRHQLADIQQQWRLSGTVFCHSDRCGHEDRKAIARPRQG